MGRNMICLTQQVEVELRVAIGGLEEKQGAQ